MPRKQRIQYPGAIYHIMSRGDRREDIFLDDVDRYDFLKTLAEACHKTSWQVHAYCLMKNHFHLVVETPEANLIDGMRWLQSTYTIRLNNRHKLFGHVFSGRYKALLVDGSGTGYLKTVCDYVHLNPVRASLLRPEQPLPSYPWSSLSWYSAAPEHRPRWMRVDRVLGAHGIQEDTPEGRQEFQGRIEARRQAEQAQEEDALRQIRHGWCFGSQQFRQELLDQFASAQGEHQTGELRLENAQSRAERIIHEELGVLGWSKAVLSSQPKNDPAKLAIGARLRRETTLTTKEIAARLQLGTSKSATTALHRWMRNHPITSAQIASSSNLVRT
jgi:REP element-mobilizing transposase RayT